MVPIVVLEELDEFKKGSDLINFAAREFIRELDSLTDGRCRSRTACRSGRSRGACILEIGETCTRQLVNEAFTRNKADHRILAVAEQLQAEHAGKRPVIIVSKDINLRMKARSLGIPAEDYETDKIRNIDTLYTGTRLRRGHGPGADHARCTTRTRAPCRPPRCRWAASSPCPTSTSSSATAPPAVLARFNPDDRDARAGHQAAGLRHRPAQRRADLRARRAARGRTSRSSPSPARPAPARRCWPWRRPSSRRRDYQQIYLARPVVPLGNRDIGYLPGDIKSKLDPYMQPLWDNLSVIRHRSSAGQQGSRSASTRCSSTEKLPHRAARLHPGAQPLQRLLHRRRGAEPHAPRGQDDHHPRRRGHQDRASPATSSRSTRPTSTASPTA